MRIISASSISYQNSFDNPGFSSALIKVEEQTKVIEPEYDDIIPPASTRRMNQAVLMATATSINCLSNLDGKPEGIIVATAHGSPHNTKKFLKSIHFRKGNLLSPTPFMLSTHNTIAGQLSILTKNPGYNTTYTQNSLSFEHALIDTKMQIEEGANCFLVGSSDEFETELHDHKFRIKERPLCIGEGASFFIIAKPNNEETPNILDVEAHSNISDREEIIENFLNKNKRSLEEIDKIYFSIDNGAKNQFLSRFDHDKLIDLKLYSKIYYTMSSFGLHLAFDYLVHNPNETVLVINNLIESNLGLMLISNNKWF